MGVEGDDLVAVAHPADDVAQAVDLHLVIAQLLHLRLDAVDNLLLLTALAGVRDHLSQEPGHVGLIALGRRFDRFKIHIADLHINVWNPVISTSRIGLPIPIIA